MTIPSSTYRLQFRNGMTFDRAAALVPYFKSLGISHLYASPIFSATSGSTHGYDVIDCNEIDSVLGGRDGFDKLVAALRDAGLELIIDIVPNHMAASPENAWWSDVIRNGKESAFARHFDIDWSEPLTLPVLGQSFEDAGAAGEISVVKEQGGEFAFAYFEHRFPLSAETAAFLATLSPQDIEAFKNDPQKLRDLHEQQHWRLLYWKEASHHLSYRRFFEVTGLVGLRVEDETVFEDSHRLILELVRDNYVQGLRVDHIDGLADPAGYAERLRAAAGPATYIIVEKILGHGELLPPKWPIEGTTGYEFIAAMPDLFVDGAGLERLDKAYRTVAGDLARFDQGLLTAKTTMARVNFAGEVSRLARIAARIDKDFDAAQIAAAIQALLVAFPVYRTYGYHNGFDEQDRQVFARVLQDARQGLPDSRALDFVAGLLSDAPASQNAFEFRARFQQLSGPVMAKAMEDTFFYRYNRLLATNEVGGEPQEEPKGCEGFHAAMHSRAKHQPFGLSASSTHDTKRGEDARARLFTLSEGADIWLDGVERWRRMNASFVTNLADGPAPEPNVEWMLYQALAGIWPEDMQSTDVDALTERFVAYAEKALRESKLRTDWGQANFDYEEAVRRYAKALLSPDNMGFTEDFGTVLRVFIQAGYLNSMAQTAVKLMAPGVPDIYQGAEGLDFSLVDPDNRRDIDFETLQTSLARSGAIETLPVQELKQRIVATGLRLRLDQPLLFKEGAYVPLAVQGPRAPHVLAFARSHGADFVIVVVPRLMFGNLTNNSLLAEQTFWDDTFVTLPDSMTDPKRDLLTERSYEEGEQLPVSKLLGRQPVAILTRIT